MTTIRIKAWVPISDLVHVSTTWQVAYDKECTNVISEVTSDSSLNIVTLDFTVPLNEVYWVRAKRHFDDSNADYWTEAKEITNNITNHSLILAEDIFVDTPSVFCDIEGLFDDTKLNFEISSGKFRGNDGHVSAHWIITDSLDRVLFSRLYDTTNLLSIIIDKDTALKTATQLKIKVIHVSSNGVESKPGELVVELNDFNFEITSNLSELKSFSNQVLDFKLINASLKSGLKRMDIFAASGERLWYKILNEVELSVTIPWYVMTPASEFKLVISAINKTGVVSVLNTIIQTQSNKVRDVIDPEYVYSKVFEPANKLTDIMLPNGITSQELGSSAILLPLIGKTDISKAVYNPNTTEYVVTVDKVNGLSTLNGTNDNTYIKVLENNLLLIDTMTSNGFPMFLVYRHTLKNDTYTLVNALVRENEQHPVGMTNAIVQINDIEFVYIPHGTNVIRKYNIVQNQVIDLNNIPLPNLISSVMLRLSGDRLLIMGGTDFTMKVYHLADDEFSDGISTMPGSFINRNLKTVRLINGDYLIFKTSQKVGDTESSVLYFDYSELTFTELPIVFDSDSYPTSVVTLLSGEVIFLRYTEVDGVGSSKQLLFK